MMRRLLLCLGLLLPAGTAVAQHNHAGSGMASKAPEAFTATPAFGPDGTLWLVRTEGNRVVVVRSSDLGRTFTAPVAVTPEPLDLDWGPDARARIAVDPKGVAIVTFAIFQDKNFNGRAFHARSTDNGASFSKPLPLTPDTTSQRFETVAGVTSSPPAERGSSSRNSRAACNSASSVGGRRRVRSISSAATAIAGPSARALWIAAAVGSLNRCSARSIRSMRGPFGGHAGPLRTTPGGESMQAGCRLQVRRAVIHRPGKNEPARKVR
jgi:hypothetical protein